MSSMLRSRAIAVGPLSKFFDVLTASYEEDTIINSDTFFLPIPFTVINQVLDINIRQSSKVGEFITNGTGTNNDVSFQAKMMGGSSLIFSLGPNFTSWIRNRINTYHSLGDVYTGNLKIYVKPVMTKIQIVAPRQGAGPLNDESVFGITTEAPTSSEYIGGGELHNYYTCWVFKSPLTIQYEIPDGVRYMTFTSQFSAN